MNNIYRSIWNDKTGTYTAVSENAKAAGKKSTSCTSGALSSVRLTLNALSVAVMLACGANVHALPVGGEVAAGSATINTGVGTTTINQSTQNAVINWQSFNIAPGQSVQFVQPNASSVALNRVVGANPSSILGNLSANGKVFLVNPNGILFGQGASVNVGGLVASTLAITNNNFMAGNYTFAGAGAGAIVNQGTINANGGYVALLGANVSNQGVIAANLGSVVLAAGNGITLDVAGDGLLNVMVDQGSVNALVENGGLIRANGGQVLLTASAAGDLLRTVVNNTGVIEAQTLDNRSGTIKLLGDMQSGAVNVSGTLDASAPLGGNGGFIDTSAAHVRINDTARVTTAAPSGATGNWLIDPQDITIGNDVGDTMTGAALAAQLVTNNITITTAASGTGNGDITIREASFVEWTATPNRTTLTLNALRDININAYVAPTNGNLVMTAGRDVNVNAYIKAVSGNISVCCGRDLNINAAMTTDGGSMLLGAGRNLNLNRGSPAVAATPDIAFKPVTLGGTVTATDGNITMCAAENINIDGKITLTRGTAIPELSLGLPLGLVLSAGYGASAPGIGGGTLNFAATAPPITITGPNAPATVNYNPVAYTTPTDYSIYFTGTGGPVTQNMYVFADVANKTADGTTTANLTGLKGNPAGVTLVAGPGSTAVFDTADVGVNKLVSYTGYSLAVTGPANYVLATPCCGPAVARTRGTIIPAVVPLTPVTLITPTALTSIPYVAVPYTPASSIQFAPTAIPLTVVSAEMPTVARVDEFEPTTVQAPVAVTPPPEAPPKAFVMPKRVPKQDRN